MATISWSCLHFGCGPDVEMASFVPWVHMFLTTSMHTSGVIYSKGSIWLLNVSSLDWFYPPYLRGTVLSTLTIIQKKSIRIRIYTCQNPNSCKISTGSGHKWAKFGYYLTCSCFLWFHAIHTLEEICSLTSPAQLSMTVLLSSATCIGLPPQGSSVSSFGLQPCWQNHLRFHSRDI